jgi:lysozyme family protein
MKENFETWLKFEMQHECVFERGHYGDFDHVISENVSGDSGGLTKFGIDQASHPHVNIRALDYDGAAQIFRDAYWNRVRGDELPAGYDMAVSDIAVNNGTGTAAKLLQRACNHAKVDPPITEDGYIGPKTIAAANKAGADGLCHLIALRENHYLAIVENHPTQHKFLRGWLDRNKDLAQLVTAPAKGKAA